MKNFFVTVLAVLGAYTVYDWYKNNHASTGGPNPVASEVGGTADTNQSSPTQLISGIPSYNPAPVANGHGDQVAAALHSNRYSISSGSANYTPAFGPNTNRGSD